MIEIRSEIKQDYDLDVGEFFLQLTEKDFLYLITLLSAFSRSHEGIIRIADKNGNSNLNFTLEEDEE